MSIYNDLNRYASEHIVGTSIKKQKLFINKFLTNYFGGTKVAKQKIQDIINDCPEEEDSLIYLFKKIGYFSTPDIFTELIHSKNLLELTSSANKTLESIPKLDSTTIQKSLKVFDAMEKTVSDLMSPDNLKEIKIYSRTELAQEFDISRRTLNKWLKYKFNTKFDNTTKFTLDEYAEIWLNFTLKDSEDKYYISGNLAQFIKRINGPMNFNRTDLIKDGLYYKSIKENLSKKDKKGLFIDLDLPFKTIPFSIYSRMCYKLGIDDESEV